MNLLVFIEFVLLICLLTWAAIAGFQISESNRLEREAIESMEAMEPQRIDTIIKLNRSLGLPDNH